MALSDWLGNNLPFLGIGDTSAVTNPDQSTSVGGWTFAPGYGSDGGSIPTSGPAQGLFTGTDWSKVGSAIQSLGGSDSSKADDPNKTDGTAAKQPMGVAGTASAQVGQPLTRINPDTAVKMMQQRVQNLMQAATAPKGSQGYGQPIQQPRTSWGLLGF